MPRGQLEPVAHYLRRMASPPADQDLADGQLVERYVSGHDHEAFAALVRRYGQLVRWVCRRVLHQEQDADDAFQATFLVLASKAASIRKSSSVASWLYGVAYRTAMNAKRARMRRSEEQASIEGRAGEQPATEASLREIQAILDDEVNRLPEKYKAPFVLCCMDDKSRAEAAKLLGWKEGTVSGRLARARKELQQRLTRRGVALGLALCVVEMSRAGTATLPQALVNRTIGTALAFAAGKVLTADLVSSQVPALANGVLRAMMLTKLTMAAALLLTVCVSFGTAGLVLYERLAASPPERQAPAQGPDQSKPAAALADLAHTDLYGDPLPPGAICRMGSLQWRHTGLAAFAMAADGKTVLTTGTDGGLQTWEAASGKLLRSVKLPGDLLGRLALAPDGKVLAGWCSEKLVFWDTESGKEIKSLATGHGVFDHLQFSPDGRILATGAGNWPVSIWDWRDGQRLTLAGPAVPQSLDSTFHFSFSPDSKRLAVCVWWMKPLCIYDTATGRELHRIDCHAISSTFSPDGKRLAICTQPAPRGGNLPKEIRLIEASNGKELACFPLGTNDFPESLAFSPDGKLLACGAYGKSCLVDLTSGEVRQRLPGLTHLAFARNGEVLIGTEFSRLRFFNTATGKELYDRPSSFGHQSQIALSPDGRQLASACELEDSVYIWDTMNGRLIRRWTLSRDENALPSGLAFTSDGRTLLVGRRNGHVEFWDSLAAKQLRTIALRNAVEVQKGSVYFLLHGSADGKHFTTIVPNWSGPTYSCKRLQVWESATGKLVRDYPVPSGKWDCSWAPDGLALELPTDDGMELRDVESGRTRFKVPGTSKGGIVAASPDQRLIALLETKEMGRPGLTDKESTVGIWEAATGHEIARIATGPAAHLALVAGGRCLVTSDKDFLHVWDLATGTERRRWALPSRLNSWEASVVNQLLAVPDGRRVVTVLYNGTALVWDLSPVLDSPEALATPDDKLLAAWWADLAADDAQRAYAAVWRLAETRDRAIPFLREHLRPAPEPDMKKIRQHITDLDSNAFAIREKAHKELERLGIAAEPALRQALQQEHSPEMLRRVEKLLETFPMLPLPAEMVRALRALHALELMNTPDARALIRKLALGASEAPLTRAATAAMERSARRPPVQP
jgi:RNA polymerase sigma factor (sigma-70 family)